MELTSIYKILLALLLSGLIGLERERHQRAAGFRTHILVGIGSTLMMIVSINMYRTYGASTDPSRIAAQVLSGIGFLGAGTIIRFKASIRGLTTAASLWAVAGIGLAVGSAEYGLAAVTTAIILVVLFLLSDLEKKITLGSRLKTIELESCFGFEVIQETKTVLAGYGAYIKDFNIEKSKEKEGLYIIRFNVKISDRYSKDIKKDLSRIEDIKSVIWI
jgi:putative Mg2+ transporter-C (MgtC) family protein